jgi:hypothetical protein
MQGHAHAPAERTFGFVVKDGSTHGGDASDAGVSPIYPTTENTVKKA